MLNQAIEDWVFLAGRPPLQEYLGFIGSQAPDEHALDVSQLIQAWGRANDRVRELEANEAGAANNPVTHDVPESLVPLAQAAMANPVLQRSFSAVPTAVRMIDLETLVVFQKFINLRYVAELRQQLASDMSPEAIFRFAVPDHSLAPQPSVGRANQNTWVAMSASTDLRFLGPAFLSANQVPGYPPTGYPSGVLALALGFGSNIVNAISVAGRLVLNNGSHRCYALYEAGLRQIPSIVQTVTRAEELTVIASGDLVTSQARYLEEPRPPMLRDYFDQQLRTIVPVPRKYRQVRITFGVEQVDVPAPG